MSGIDDLPPLREVVAEFGLAAKKSLGQNFLFDLNLTSRIARAAGPLEDVTVIEVGPGPGGLTRALLACGARKVIAIERDERCLAALDVIARHFPGRLEIVAADALEVDYPALAEKHAEGAAVRIAANLPYNIATVLLGRWLESESWPPFYDKLTLMFQREVALRIAATPAQRADYGRLAVLAGWRTQARILFDVSPAAFTPPPKVTSSIVELVPKASPLPCTLKYLTEIAQAAFGQRRKMLRQSLKQLALKQLALKQLALKQLALKQLDVDVALLLERAGIAPTARAEEIDVAGFARLAQALETMRTG